MYQVCGAVGSVPAIRHSILITNRRAAPSRLHVITTLIRNTAPTLTLASNTPSTHSFNECIKFLHDFIDVGSACGSLTNASMICFQLHFPPFSNCPQFHSHCSQITLARLPHCTVTHSRWPSQLQLTWSTFVDRWSISDAAAACHPSIGVSTSIPNSASISQCSWILIAYDVLQQYLSWSLIMELALTELWQLIDELALGYSTIESTHGYSSATSILMMDTWYS